MTVQGKTDYKVEQLSNCKLNTVTQQLNRSKHQLDGEKFDQIDQIHEIVKDNHSKDIKITDCSIPEQEIKSDNCHQDLLSIGNNHDTDNSDDMNHISLNEKVKEPIKQETDEEMMDTREGCLLISSIGFNDFNCFESFRKCH